MRKLVIALLVVLAGAGFLAYRFTRTLPVLTVMTWPGAYGRAQAAALMRPYGEKADVSVHVAEYDGGTARLRRAVATRSYDADVIDLELPTAVEACRDGLLERIDTAGLPPGADGVPAARDFVAGAVGPCWVGSVVYSQTIIAAPGSAAASLADFFDLKKFPGGRGLREGPKFNLEMALLADGVPPASVYATLASETGLARAFAKLDTIRASVLWWPAAGTPVSLLSSGRAALSTILNGDIYDAAIHSRGTFKVIWDRQLYELDVFGVPRGNPKKNMAMDFIRFATDSQRLAHISDWVPYGPARRSSLAFVDKNPELGIAMTPYLPTAPKNFPDAFAVDDAWWLDHRAGIDAHWRAWLAQTR